VQLHCETKRIFRYFTEASCNKVENYIPNWNINCRNSFLIALHTSLTTTTGDNFFYTQTEILRRQLHHPVHVYLKPGRLKTKLVIELNSGFTRDHLVYASASNVFKLHTNKMSFSLRFCMSSWLS